MEVTFHRICSTFGGPATRRLPRTHPGERDAHDSAACATWTENRSVISEMAVLFIALASSAAFYAPPIVPSHATTASRTSQPIVMKRWDKRKVRNSPLGQ